MVTPRTKAERLAARHAGWWFVCAGGSGVLSIFLIGFLAPDLTAAYEGHPNARSFVAMVLIAGLAVVLLTGSFVGLLRLFVALAVQMRAERGSAVRLDDVRDDENGHAADKRGV